MKTILKGFSFGLLLQIAVGPLCIYIVKNLIIIGLPYRIFGAFWPSHWPTRCSSRWRFSASKSVERRPLPRPSCASFGGVIILLFGLIILLSALWYQPYPAFSALDGQSELSVFVTAFVLTLSSPLTLVF